METRMPKYEARLIDVENRSFNPLVLPRSCGLVQNHISFGQECESEIQTPSYRTKISFALLRLHPVLASLKKHEHFSNQETNLDHYV